MLSDSPSMADRISQFRLDHPSQLKFVHLYLFSYTSIVLVRTVEEILIFHTLSMVIFPLPLLNILYIVSYSSPIFLLPKSCSKYLIPNVNIYIISQARNFEFEIHLDHNRFPSGSFLR